MTPIKGIDNMTVGQLQAELQQGGKFVVYLYCVSVLIMTFKRSSSIYFIRAGESALWHGIPFTLLTLLAGWWGIPWGPIFTIEALARNVQGGKDVTQEVMTTLNRAQKR
ncbi:MAG: hypothetical protein KA314_15005 [Chloroflexi bacterium]|nr:hypothetical protein [Chloroflexota bacterium]MBP8057144.1 hypothetical protein [Chloroflexota bacterium]